MRILFVNPCIRPDNPRKVFPVGLGYVVTAVKKAGYKFDLLDIDAFRYSDDYIEDFISKNIYDVIAFGCLVTHFKWAKYFTDIVKEKQPNCKIIVGNSVASSVTEILLTKTFTDIAVLGEGDITIVELLESLQKDKSLYLVKGIAFMEGGKVIFTEKRDVIKDINTIQFIDREIFDIREYLNASRYNAHEPYPMPEEDLIVMNVNTARGCPFRCTFCYNVFTDESIRYRWRDISSIISEIKYLIKTYGANYIQLYDELTFANKKRIGEFVDSVIKEKLNIYWTGVILAGVLDEDDGLLAEKLKQSGCVGMGFSLESADEEILLSMQKKINLSKFIITRRILKEANIATHTSVVFGFPQETPETIKKTIDFCIKEQLSPSAGFLLPMPKTPIYKYALERGLIKDEYEYLLGLGDRQDFHINLTSMTDDIYISTVKSEVKRCQQELGINLDDPMKTVKFRSRDKI
ncbi:MAG: radical SAM protein [Nitrospirae bacterium]|nr:radical SAM protein [Nitrospirota bacterium]